MRIVIVGAGVVGSNLAAELSKAGHVVSIVDNDPTLVEDLNEHHDVLAVQGNGAQPSILRQAGIEEAKMVIAVTNIDEVNLVICMLAKKFGVKHKIARIRNKEYAGADAILKPSEVGIDTIINPEDILTQKITRILDTPGATDCAIFAHGCIQFLTFDINENSPIAGLKLKDLRKNNDINFLVAAIFRGDQSIVPRGDDEIRQGDHIGVVADASSIKKLLPLMQSEVLYPKHIVIFGASSIALDVVASLEQKYDHLTLIEHNKNLAQHAASQYEKILVLNGEMTDDDILREADFSHCDYFLALSDNDQNNLLAALVARHRGVKHTAVVTRDPNFVPILSNIGMEAVLNPRLAAVGAILTHIRRGQVHGVTRIKESEAEIIELEAAKGSKITKKPLAQLTVPDGSLIVAVLRDDEMLIPGGQTQIQAGETVLVFALPEAIKSIEKLFSKGLF